VKVIIFDWSVGEPEMLKFWCFNSSFIAFSLLVLELHQSAIIAVNY